MRRLTPLQSEILGSADEAVAEGALPDSVDQHARHERMFASSEPARQPQAIARRPLGIVTPSSGLSEREISSIIDEAKLFEEEDRKKAEMSRITARLEGLLDTNVKAFAEFGELLDKEKKESVREVLDNARRAMAGDSVSEATEVLEKLGEVSQILTEVMLYDPTTFQSASEQPRETEEETPPPDPPTARAS